MTTPDLPPVGATVTDADGTQWVFMPNPVVPDYSRLKWRTQYGDGQWHVADEDAAPGLTALSRAEQRLAAIDAACLEVCRDNHGPTVGADAVDTDAGRYVCMDEHGRPIIDTSDPVEVIRRLDRLWETAVKRHEDAEQRIKEWRAEYDAATELLATVMSQRDDLTQRLATFEALAREADLNCQSAGPGTLEHAVSIIERLAALATPVEDTTHG